MSGGGGGTGNHGENGVIYDCDNIKFVVAISSPQESGLNGLKSGENLRVRVDRRKVLVVRLDTGTVIGSINWANNDQLIRCIEAGTEYVAKVLSIDDGLVRVQVATARKH